MRSIDVYTCRKFFARLFYSQNFLLAVFVVSLIILVSVTMPAKAGINKNRFIIKYRTTAATSDQVFLTSITEGQKTFRHRAEILNVPVRQIQRLSNGAEVVEIPDSLEAKKLLQDLQQQPDVEYIEPDNILTAKLIPNDTLFNEQWHYFEAEGGINLPEAWDITLGDPEIVVAVIDTGIVQIRDEEGQLTTHPDLAGKVLPGFDFISDLARGNDGDGRDADASDAGDFLEIDECGPGNPALPINSSWHGTHVAGTIAANTNDGFGVAGVAANVKLLPVRVLGKCGGLISEIAEGIRWAAGLPVLGVSANPNPAKVINMSLGSLSDCSRTMQEAITAARAAGTTIVVAAGNEAQDALNSQPANCVGVVSVASNDRDGGRAFYSNTGLIVDVAAPGGVLPLNGVLSTYNSGRKVADPEGHDFEFLQGTSMAAPHVAGVAALIFSLKPDLTPGQVESILKTTSRAFPTDASNPCTKAECGEGIVDAAAALKMIQSGNIPSDIPESRFENATNILIPASGELFAESLIDVNREGASQLVRVEIDIQHINAADLKITLFAPTGDFLVVKEFGGEIKNDFSARLVVNAGAIPAEGNWSLRVADRRVRPGGSGGFIDTWSLEFLE